jgi:hypothetical protein
MAGKTQGERIDELSHLAAILNERLDNVRKEVEGIHVEQDKTAEGVNELKTKLAVIDERLGELKKGLEEAGRRRWAVVPSVVGGLIGAVLAFLGQLLITYLKK